MGSPPLTRGQRPRPSAIIVHDGITPAHAGTTLHSQIDELVEEDHPRSRGDNVIPFSFLTR